MPSQTRHLLLVGLTFAGLGAGCAAIAPSQLVTAREAYSRSSAGLAARWTPQELEEGRKMLDRANSEFQEHGDTLAVHDYAYIANRKFELADARARNEVDRQRIAEATAQGIVVRDEQASQSQEALARARAQLHRERIANDAATMVLQAARVTQGQELAQAEGQVEVERQGRAEAEARLARAMHELTAIAAVHEDARGVVITLNGGVLFAFSQATLLTTARAKLDQVAEALKDQSPEKRMVVEGHTDSLGSDAVNRPLSQRRAGAVRDYLISRGVAPEKVTAVGLGSSRPLLDNTNPENRANNRRVEIVIRATGITTRESLPTPRQEQ